MAFKEIMDGFEENLSIQTTIIKDHNGGKVVVSISKDGKQPFYLEYKKEDQSIKSFKKDNFLNDSSDDRLWWLIINTLEKGRIV